MATKNLKSRYEKIAMINRRHVEKLDDSCFLEYAIENDSDKVKQVIN